jgi:hypothetical protein
MEAKMFVRIKRHPYSDKYTVLICHSQREHQSVKQIVIHKMGTSNAPEQIAMMKADAEKLVILMQRNADMIKEEIRQQRQEESIQLQLDEIREVNRLHGGVNDIIGTLYDELNFNKILNNPKANELLKAVVLARFTEPSSKLKASELLQRKFGLEYSVDSIYRMMDGLFKNIEKAQQIVFDSTVAAVGKQIDLMFFDVTTLHFETIEEDELRQFGFSKDFRFNTTQVVLALATTCEGLPIGYKLFPGSIAEVTTLINCVNAWKDRINIRDTVVVADRGMMSENNLNQLVTAGMNYVVACPLRKLSSDVKTAVLDKSRYDKIMIDNQAYLKQEINLDETRRLIVTYSQKRADKDRKDRERLIKRIEKRLGKSKQMKSLISNQGYIKYVTTNGTTTAGIDQEKVARDAQWDGLHGVVTNTDLSAETVVKRYRNLWVIEESFRINKHNLQMRPIYHFTPRRIHAHIAICFLTYALIRQVQYKLKQHNIPLSIEAIRDGLLEVQASIITNINTGELYRMPSHMTEEIKDVYRVFARDFDLTPRRYA